VIVRTRVTAVRLFALLVTKLPKSVVSKTHNKPLVCIQSLLLSWFNNGKCAGIRDQLVQRTALSRLKPINLTVGARGIAPSRGKPRTKHNTDD
jgi:hypothetical protein